MKTGILRGLQEVFQACRWGIYGPSMGHYSVQAKRVAKFKQNAAACATVEPRLNRTPTKQEPKVRFFGLQVGYALGYRNRNPLPAGLSLRKLEFLSHVFHGSFTRGIKESEIQWDAKIISPSVNPLLTQWYASAIRSQCVRIHSGYSIQYPNNNL